MCPFGFTFIDQTPAVKMALCQMLECVPTAHDHHSHMLSLVVLAQHTMQASRRDIHISTQKVIAEGRGDS